MWLNHDIKSHQIFFSKIGIMKNKNFHTFSAESTFSKVVLKYLVHLKFEQNDVCLQA